MPMAQELQLMFLGNPEIRRDGTLVAGVSFKKALALLCYLAVTGRPHLRATLVGLLWGDMPEAYAQNNLSKALTQLRHAVGRHLCITRQEVAFDRDSPYWLDVEAFGKSACAGADVDRLQGAVDLYRGDFLEGFYVRAAPAFEEWVLAQRARLRELALQALHTLAVHHTQRGAVGHAAGIEVTTRLLALDPWREEAHRQLMTLLAQSGQRGAALAQYEICRQVLAKELGVEPGAETTALYEQIRDGQDLSGFPADASRGKPAQRRQSASDPDRSAGNLPARLTPFVGREETLVEIEGHLRDPGCRLLTLVGPGGSGKTRLALEAAARQVARFAHGAWFVSLSPLQSAEAIVPTIAQAIGFSFYSGGEPKELLLNYLRGKNALLVLDNYEHLLEGVELVPEILQTAPGVKALLTSRAALNVLGESLYPVSGMNYPTLMPLALTPPTEDGRSPSPADAPRSVGIQSVGRRGELADIAQYSAVRLFVDGARRARPDFELTNENLADVVRICHLVDGMPLALLLAAAWLKVLAPAEIADQIDPALGSESGRHMTGLDFLTSDLRDAPERQRSMRAVFDHSWNLLTAHERAVMQALSVFRGGCTREAAQAVAGASLHNLLALVDCSLLQRDAPSRGGRFEMHELLRQYAGEKLGRSPSACQAARDAHCAYYAAALQRWAGDLKGPRQQAALAEMEADVENARAAWEWAVEHEEVEWLGQAMEGLGLFYDWRARYADGEAAFRVAAAKLARGQAALSADGLLAQAAALAWQSHFSQLLGHTEVARRLQQEGLGLLQRPELAGCDTRRERAFLLQEMGATADLTGRRKEARQPLAQSLALYRELGDRWGTANVLFALSVSAESLGASEEAAQNQQECLSIRRALGDQRGIAYSLSKVAISLYGPGKFDRAEGLAREAVAICRAMGDRASLQTCLWILGLTLYWRGDFDGARVCLEESLAIGRDLGSHVELARLQISLGQIKGAQGQYEEGFRLVQQGLDLAREADDQWGIGYGLVTLGRVSLAQGAYDQARDLLQESTVRFAKTSYSGLGCAHANLGCAMHMLGDPERARQHVWRGLQIAAETYDIPCLTSIIPAAALLMAGQGRVERAVELYALASRWALVANSRWFQNVYGRHVDAAAATLPPEVIAAARERGRARDLRATVDELLDEMRELVLYGRKAPAVSETSIGSPVIAA
jgi:predicted ATPase/DNA-binding SARP family transcriptional activator